VSQYVPNKYFLGLIINPDDQAIFISFDIIVLRNLRIFPLIFSLKSWIFDSPLGASAPFISSLRLHGLTADAQTEQASGDARNACRRTQELLSISNMLSAMNDGSAQISWCARLPYPD
jgi:hypothetical protein